MDASGGDGFVVACCGEVLRVGGGRNELVHKGWALVTSEQHTR